MRKFNNFDFLLIFLVGTLSLIIVWLLHILVVHAFGGSTEVTSDLITEHLPDNALDWKKLQGNVVDGSFYLEKHMAKSEINSSYNRGYWVSISVCVLLGSCAGILYLFFK